jgi:hypothetical protein
LARKPPRAKRDAFGELGIQPDSATGRAEKAEKLKS